jgi:hypothetical protein
LLFIKQNYKQQNKRKEKKEEKRKMPNSEYLKCNTKIDGVRTKRCITGSTCDKEHEICKYTHNNRPVPAGVRVVNFHRDVVRNRAENRLLNREMLNAPPPELHYGSDEIPCGYPGATRCPNNSRCDYRTLKGEKGRHICLKYNKGHRFNPDTAQAVKASDYANTRRKKTVEERKKDRNHKFQPITEAQRQYFIRVNMEPCEYKGMRRCPEGTRCDTGKNPKRCRPYNNTRKQFDPAHDHIPMRRETGFKLKVPASDLPTHHKRPVRPVGEEKQREMALRRRAKGRRQKHTPVRRHNNIERGNEQRVARQDEEGSLRALARNVEPHNNDGLIVDNRLSDNEFGMDSAAEQRLRDAQIHSIESDELRLTPLSASPIGQRPNGQFNMHNFINNSPPSHNGEIDLNTYFDSNRSSKSRGGRKTKGRRKTRKRKHGK